MKPVLVFSLITLSLGANAALVWQLRRPAEVADASSASGDSRSASALTASSSASRPPGSKGPGTGQVPGGTWDALKGDASLPGLVDRLRAAGYPARLIRLIVSIQINEQNAARWEELALPTPTNNYWTTRLPGGTAPRDPALLAARRQLSREENDLLKSLLGPDASEDSPEAATLRQRQYGNLSVEKIAQAQEIIRDYQELTQQVRAETQGVTLQEDREKLAFLEAERRKDLAKLMTPEEYEEYMLRTSSTASSVRFQLSAMKPTEQEFRAIYKLQEAFDEQYGTVNLARPTPELAQARMAAQKQLVEEIKGILGPERGTEYERSRDYSYQSAAAIAKRLDLPRESAGTVYELQQQTQQRIKTLQQDQTLTPAQRQAQIAALAADAQAKVVATLGERGAAAYRETGGDWLNRIVPPAPRGGANVPLVPVIIAP